MKPIFKKNVFTATPSVAKRKATKTVTIDGNDYIVDSDIKFITIDHNGDVVGWTQKPVPDMNMRQWSYCEASPDNDDIYASTYLGSYSANVLNWDECIEEVFFE